MEEKRADTKPLSFIGKSEIAQKAETAEARAEAEKEAKRKAEENTQEFRLVFGTAGKYPDGTSWERDATPEEASRAFNAQAEDATKAMQEYIERGVRRQ